jgi:hypothetical protein
MVNANQAKGARAEATVEAGLLRAGHPKAERIRVKHPDRGDIGGIGGWTIEVKNISRIELAAVMDQLRRAQLTTGSPWGAAVIQRRNHGVGRWYWVMEFEQGSALAGLTQGGE